VCPLPSVGGSPATQTGNDIGRGRDLASGQTLIAQGQNLQQSQGFLSLFDGRYILKDGLGLSVLSDHQWLSLLTKVFQYLGGVGLEVADRLDPR